MCPMSYDGTWRSMLGKLTVPLVKNTTSGSVRVVGSFGSTMPPTPSVALARSIQPGRSPPPRREATILVLRLGSELVIESIFAEPASLRSEEHKSELQSLMRISYDVYCLKKKK